MLLKEADDHVASIDKQFQRGLITEDERYEQVVNVWKDTTAQQLTRWRSTASSSRWPLDTSSALTSSA